MNNIARHYDRLIEENNDPVHDPKPLRDYMDKWDGKYFIDKLQLDEDKSVLEIGVGTGRLAIKVLQTCGKFVGIDISAKTILKAKENLCNYKNATLICDDFLQFESDEKFDVIYSSLTFMHIKEKKKAIQKVSSLLRDNGRFVLSIDKNQEEIIDAGISKITVFPDNPIEITEYIKCAGLTIEEQYNTQFANIFVAAKLK